MYLCTVIEQEYLVQGVAKKLTDNGVVRIGSFFYRIPHGGTFTATTRDYC